MLHIKCVQCRSEFFNKQNCYFHLNTFLFVLFHFPCISFGFFFIYYLFLLELLADAIPHLDKGDHFL